MKLHNLKISEIIEPIYLVGYIDDKEGNKASQENLMIRLKQWAIAVVKECNNPLDDEATEICGVPHRLYWNRENPKTTDRCHKCSFLIEKFELEDLK